MDRASRCGLHFPGFEPPLILNQQVPGSSLSAPTKLQGLSPSFLMAASGGGTDLAPEDSENFYIGAILEAAVTDVTCTASAAD
jgi:hypothetical protein